MRPPSLKAADFQKALGSRPVSRTAHFVLHALPFAKGDGARTDAAAAQAAPASATELSTSDTAAKEALVDDFALDLSDAGIGGSSADPVARQAWRLGLVLPKKQARRSVTRSLIRHQAREALRRHAPAVLATGRHEVAGWVVRLRAPFDRQQFPSAASDALKAAVRRELDELWSRLACAPSAPSASGPSIKGAGKPPANADSGLSVARKPGGAA